MAQLSFKLPEIDREPTRKAVEQALGTAREYRVIGKEEMKKQAGLVESAVSRLNHIQRQVIEKRYLQDDDVYDFNVFSELHLSERKYYRIKAKAFYRLAFMLNLEVLVDEKQDAETL